MPYILQATILNAFFDRNLLYFGWNFKEVCYFGSNQQNFFIIGSWNGIWLVRWQAITWTRYADLLLISDLSTAGKHIVLFPANIWGKWLINGTKKNNQSQNPKHPAKSAQLWLVGCVLDFFLVELKLQNIKIFILIVTLQFCYCCHLMHNHVVGKGAFGKMHRNYFFKHRD